MSIKSSLLKIGKYFIPVSYILSLAIGGYIVIKLTEVSAENRKLIVQLREDLQKDSQLQSQYVRCIVILFSRDEDKIVSVEELDKCLLEGVLSDPVISTDDYPVPLPIGHSPLQNNQTENQPSGLNDPKEIEDPQDPEDGGEGETGVEDLLEQLEQLLEGLETPTIVFDLLSILESP